MEPIFRPRRMAHVNYWVDDWEKAARWHRDVGGLGEAYRRQDLKGAFLSNGNTYHDSAVFDLDTPRGKGKRPGLHHIAFELENEVELVEGFKRCEGYGFKFDFMLSADVAHCCYGRDPEGHLFEVYTDVLDNWRERRQGEINSGGGSVPWVPGETPPISESLYPVNPTIDVIEGASLHTKRASHAVLVAKDHDVLYRHYTELVGLTPLVGGLGAPFSILAGSLGEEALAIFGPGVDAPSGLHHGGFELMDESDLDKASVRLAARGVSIEKTIDHPARRGVYVRDPSGNLLQYFVNGAASLATLADLPSNEALWLA